MTESMIDPSTYSIPVKDTSGNNIGIYLYLDTVDKYGQARILEFLNITPDTQINEDGSKIPKFVFDQRTIESWSLPQYYISNGVEIEIGSDGTEIVDGKEVHTRVITREETKAYIMANATEISGFAIQTKIKFVE